MTAFAQLSSCDGDHGAPRASNVSYLALYRKDFLTPGLAQGIAVSAVIVHVSRSASCLVLSNYSAQMNGAEKS